MQRDDNDRRGQHDAEHGVVEKRVVRPEAPVHHARERQHDEHHAEQPRQDHRHVEPCEALRHRREQPDRHQDGGGRHARHDQAQAPKQAAEEKAEEARAHRVERAVLRVEQNGGEGKKAGRAGKVRAASAPLRARLGPQARERAEDQADEQAGRELFRAVEQHKDQPAAAQETEDRAGADRQQEGKMAAQPVERVGEHLHHRPVDAEDDRQHAAGDARQDVARADDEALHQPQQDRLEGETHF